MLTNLSFLDIGNYYPPESEIERLQTYHDNHELFEGEHQEVFKEQFERVARIIGNFDKVISYANVINYHKLITLKTADLLLGETPKITAGDKGTPKQIALESIISNTDLFNTLYQVAIDISRYGTGLVMLYEDGFGQIDITSPRYYYQIVDSFNIKKTINHVLISEYEENEIKYITARIHYKGYYEERVLRLEKCKIKDLVSSIIVKTGLDDFAVIPMHNILTSETIYGMDDYSDINSLVSEIEVRISQIAKILDKHSDPSVQIPSCVLDQDPATGEYKLKLGNAFILPNKEQAEVKYITWDANLEANFKMLDLLLNQLYIMSEMGSVILGSSENLGIVSGTALKKMAMSALAKVARIKTRMDLAVKKAISLASQLGGTDITLLKQTDISIEWKDGLPNDDKEQAEIMQIRTGNKPTVSQKTAIKNLMSCDDTTAQEEYETILKEQEESMTKDTTKDPSMMTNNDSNPSI